MSHFLQSFSKEYLDDILVRLAHHSSAIEGNTISLPATVSIIVNGTLPLNGKATVREFYEIENHKQAFENVLSHLLNDDPLTIDIVKEIHADLTDRLQYDRGQFKKSENMILGAEFATASPAETPMLLTQLFDNLVYRLEADDSSEDKLKSILETHIQFERIHPFSDGNGRTGRMIMIYSLLQEGFPPLIIEKENRATYIELLATQNLNDFLTFAEESMKKEQQRMQAFKNKEVEKINFEGDNSQNQ
ncbi:MAG: Fic family protein [Alkalibacterium sp.]|uniref:Fic/DOC family protein n=1 Tax=Alkalibacterium gilvum TaxID=1130080 RepID=A0A1H6V1I8_9LACT|nr:Fic family protein [Alkalibacterium gilvum]MDN6194534.1 Fic family protein [Alkalibacterium sp.]MDN6327473.1 Fic family protein [Alkalibacterium sp.]MDN6730497.1 Fic family protein [Alkalibacterium sp.]SEI97746.1 Fic/DOC family protein [Alkalibacterium gilvum]